MGSVPLSFFQSVYLVVARIPRGRVATYGQIARLCGRSSRAARVVGYAMRAAPSDRQLPCHRVVNQTGLLSPEEVFGPGVQRRLLEEEGIPFLADGRIDMARSLWRPGED